MNEGCRVRLKENPGVVGIVLDSDIVTKKVYVHWGVSDGEKVQSWTDLAEVEVIPGTGLFYPNTFLKKEDSNGQV